MARTKSKTDKNLPQSKLESNQHTHESRAQNEAPDILLKQLFASIPEYKRLQLNQFGPLKLGEENALGAKIHSIRQTIESSSDSYRSVHKTVINYSDGTRLNFAGRNLQTIFHGNEMLTEVECKSEDMLITGYSEIRRLVHCAKDWHQSKDHQWSELTPGYWRLTKGGQRGHYMDNDAEIIGFWLGGFRVHSDGTIEQYDEEGEAVCWMLPDSSLKSDNGQSLSVWIIS
jgi:hypothetical protein